MTVSKSTRVAKNTTFLYLRMLVVMCINIFSVRYVLKGLGVVDYGVFNVVAGLVTMFSSLSGIISAATTRFYSYALGEKRSEMVSEVFSASINIYFFLACAVLFIGELVGFWFINYQADIPEVRLSAANWVFQFTIITFIISLITSSFSSLVFAYERMHIFSLVSVFECILKFLLAYSLLYLSGDRLILYSIGLFVISVLVSLTYILATCRGKYRIRYKRGVDKTLYKKMLSFSGWTLFSSSAGIGISQLVTMITNVFWGPVVNAARGIAFQVSGAMNSFTSNVIMAVGPPMIKSYAEGDYQSVNKYFKFCNKAVYYSLLLILLPVFFEMETVLNLWLGVDDSQTVLFCRLILIYVLILSLNNPISIIVQATGNIRAYSTYVEIPTLLCFPITWILYAIGEPAEAAFYVMIISIFVSHLIRMVCLKRLFPTFSYNEYIKEFLLPAFVITAIVCCLMSLLRGFCEPGIMRVLYSVFLCSSLLLILCLLFGLKKYEKDFLLSFIKKKK